MLTCLLSQHPLLPRPRSTSRYLHGCVRAREIDASPYDFVLSCGLNGFWVSPQMACRWFWGYHPKWHAHVAHVDTAFRWRSPSSPSDGALKNATRSKGFDYGRLYADRPGDAIVFMPMSVSTSGRLYHDFIRLLFLHAHREAELSLEKFLRSLISFVSCVLLVWLILRDL